jgi:hypothetical protein
MNYYIDKSGEVYAFDDGQVSEGYPLSPMDAMTPEQTERHLNPAPSVPHAVTMRQARLALLAGGYLAGVDAAINALPQPQQSAARIEWDYSSEVVRSKPFVTLLGAALGLDDAQVDQLFVTAAGL